MTGGVGFTSDGANRMRNNRALLKDSTSKYFKKSNRSDKQQFSFEDKKASPELLESLRLKAKKARKKQMILTFLLVSLAVILVMWGIL